MRTFSKLVGNSGSPLVIRLPGGILTGIAMTMWDSAGNTFGAASAAVALGTDLSSPNVDNPNVIASLALGHYSPAAVFTQLAQQASNFTPMFLELPENAELTLAYIQSAGYLCRVIFYIQDRPKVIQRKSGHVARLDLDDPGASSGDFIPVTEGTLRKLGSIVLKGSDIYTLVATSLGRFLIGLNQIAGDSEIFADHSLFNLGDPTAGGIGGVFQKPELSVADVLSLGETWLSNGFSGLLEAVSGFVQITSRNDRVAAQLEKYRDDPIQVALQGIFAFALSQSNPRKIHLAAYRRRVKAPERPE